MSKIDVLRTRGVNLALATTLLLASLLSVLNVDRAQAAQVTERKITMGTSQISTSNTFAVSFKPTTVSGTGTDDILGIVVDFCSNSPLVGASCTQPAGMVTPADSSTTAVAHTGATGTPVTFTVNTASNQTGMVILTHATGLDVINAANTITFNLTVTNPSGIGTFYARILTFNSVAGAAAYTSATPGTHLDDGSVALSTARQLTINARVQEQLEFCVSAIAGTIDTNGEAPANCAAADFNGTNQTVDIGVVDSTVASISPVAAANGGNDRNGAAMIRTNAFNGAVVTYFAEQNNSSGKLKVPAAACSGTSSSDQCFNSALSNVVPATADTDDTRTSLAAAGERFGMTASAVLYPTGSTTTNLTRDTDYAGDGTAASGFEWQDVGSSAASRIASSTTVLDYEMLVLRFAARTAATTPTGSYTVTSTYIATATF